MPTDIIRHHYPTLERVEEALRRIRGDMKTRASAHPLYTKLQLRKRELEREQHEEQTDDEP